MADNGELRREIDEQTRQVQGLQMTVFSQANPAGNESLFEQLAKAEGQLAELQQQLQQQLRAHVATSAAADKAPESAPQAGRFLGKKTTGLEARARIQIDPLPTGAPQGTSTSGARPPEPLLAPDRLLCFGRQNPNCRTATNCGAARGRRSPRYR